MENVFGLLAALGLVLLNAFFVAAEFSLVSVRRSRIETLIAEGNSAAKVVQAAIKDLDRYIAATQLGITIASLGLGWVGEPALGHLVEPLVAGLLEPVSHLLPEGATGAVSAAAIGGAIAFTIITVFHVVIGELVPKSIALQNPERTSLWIARPTTWVASLFRFPIWVLNGTGNALLRLIGVPPGSEHPAALPVEELRILVRSSHEGGMLEKDEQEIIDAVFDIRNLLTRQVMIPRTDIDMLSADMPLPEIIRHVRKTPYNKFPVYGRDSDDVIGVLYVKDLLDPSPDKQTARDFCTEALFVPETLPLVRLLELFRESGKHIAIVYDEFGGTEGLVTLDDVLSKIIGELPDRYEYDQTEHQDVISRDGKCLVSGLMLIDDFNEEFGLRLSDQNYNTIGGYVMGRLERMPKVGDVVEVPDAGIVLHVDSMHDLRVDWLVVERTGDIEAEPAQAPGDTW
ncbi:MAG: HlyC/CorC family transporter [Anaerolineae bacterium]|nr:HlyC/CorC family transporter [Anaerolineae bacterium]